MYSYVAVPQERTVCPVSQSYWLLLESERVSSSQAHSSLSSVTVEKQISLIKNRVHADDRCLAGEKKKQKPSAHLEFLHNHKITPSRQADDNHFSYSGQAVRFSECVGCLETSNCFLSVNKSIHHINQLAFCVLSLLGYNSFLQMKYLMQS